MSFGQSIKIYGTVKDSLGPIPGTTVMLMGAQDSILKSFGVTNKEGLFTLTNIKPGDYIFKVSSYGFQPYETPLLVSSTSQDTALGNIQLLPKMLGVVNVQGEFVPISIMGDTIQYDARAFETGEHDNVEALLEQLPGVEVNEDGTIKAQGKDVNKILVDGEEFFGDDVTIATKNLPAGAVEKVQVYDKDSDMAEFTGIDDGQDETTINLVLKEDRKKGYFGNLEAAYGGNESNLDRYQFKGNIHYFKKKYQLSLIGMSNNLNETGFSIDDYINFMGGIQNLMRNGELNIGGDSGLPLDFGNNNGFLNTNATGLSFSYSPNDKGRLSSSIFFNTFDKTYDKTINRTTYFTDSVLYTDETTIQNSTTFNNRGNLHFKQEFDSTHFLNLNLSGQWTKAKYNNAGGITNFNGDSTLVNTYNSITGQDNFQYNFDASIDYRKKFQKKGRYTGGGISYAQNKTDAVTRLQYTSTYYLPDPNFPFSDLINQNQNQLLNSNSLSTNWMFSEPIGTRNLIQFGINHSRTSDSRDKDVSDILIGDNSLLNTILSGEGVYKSFTDEVNMSHKYISKKLKLTTRLAYNYLNLTSDSILQSPREFTYLLPSFSLQFEPSRSSEISLRYSTSTTKPTLNQLQPIQDNTNPAETILGNTGLIPEYNHDLSLQYNMFNEFSFTHFMAMLNGRYVEDNITYSQSIDSLYNRILTPENIGNEKQLNSYLSFGTSLFAIKTKFSLTNQSNISNGQVNLNTQMDEYTSVYTSNTLSIENIGKKVINVKAGLTWTWSKNIYKENRAFNNQYTNWNYFIDFTLKGKDKWVFNVNANQYLYPDFDNDSDLLLINASIARNFLESRKLQVYISAKDILNQNTGINQSYFMNYYEQERTATLGRYFLIGIKYSFQKLGAK